METNHPSKPGFNSDPIASARRQETEAAALRGPITPTQAAALPKDTVEKFKNLRNALRAGDMESLKSGAALGPQPEKPRRHLKIVTPEDK